METVLGEFDHWRHNSRKRPSGGASESQTHSNFNGIRFTWKDSVEAPTQSLSASGVRLLGGTPTTIIAADEAAATSQGTTVRLRGPRISLARSADRYKIAEIEAAEFSVDASIRPAQLPGPVGSSQVDLTSAEPIATALRNDRLPSTRAGASESVGEARRQSSYDRGVVLWTTLIQGAQGIDGVLAPGARVELDGFRARIRIADDQLTLGPGSFSIRREEQALSIDLSPQQSPESGSRPSGKIPDADPTSGLPSDALRPALLFRLRIPLHPITDSAPKITADINGGPISLAMLGLQEGDLGLFNVSQASISSRAHFELTADGHSLSLDGSGRLQNLSLRSSALSEEPIAGIDLAWRAKGSAKLDGSRAHVTEGEFSLGALRVLAKGEYQRSGSTFRVQGDVEVPLVPCQAMLDAIPDGLVAKVKDVRLAGSFGLKGKTQFDTSRLERDFNLSWQLTNSCRVTEAPPKLSVDNLQRRFTRQVQGPDGSFTELESGPGSPHWVPYGAISRFMEVAVMTTEDSGFHRHRGFDQEAIKNSIRENLRQGRFVRGASTISMQLAKNLYLARTKTLSRKLQEALLTMYLEQELTKEQLMELYLNVVEFGPMVFGIGDAAQHYFNTTASQLSLGQALYLASILPNPKVQHFVAGGAVSPGWTNYLRKLMETAAKRKWITEEELEEGLSETVVRGLAVPQRTRSSERARSHGSSEDESDAGGFGLTPPDDELRP
ncbi:biosynthetic peptidoglycan transglycosylase [Chondromyces apiculatus]|uniref:biosynthetic peptidoglycan transglycosylase n=1 Tax=Chondromyces apiculatus TaxID=51 RepID=UPI0018CC69AE|nr:biosynthetic peptidoglycan transglycosylase [Chondromyces apiculatus]